VSEAQAVLLNLDDRGVATLTINRPEKRNALATHVIEQLLQALEDVAADDRVRVLVLTGAGDKAFSAGGDLGRFLAEAEAGETAQGSRFATLFERIGRLPVPVIARINGHCLAGAFGIVLACDLIVTVDEASFGTPEILVGLWPMMITALILRNVPRKVATELMLTGRRMDAAEAKALGIVNRVVPRAELDDAVDALVETLLQHPPSVVAAGRRALFQQQDQPFLEAVRYLAQELNQVLALPEAQEGMRAFLEKRTPSFRRG